MHTSYDHIAEVEKKTSEATHVSGCSVSRIRRSETGVISSPVHPRRPCPILDSLDDFDRDTIIRTILAFYERGELPTMELLLGKVKEPPLSFAG